MNCLFFLSVRSTARLISQDVHNGNHTTFIPQKLHLQSAVLPTTFHRNEWEEVHKELHVIHAYTHTLKQSSHFNQRNWYDHLCQMVWGRKQRAFITATFRAEVKYKYPTRKCVKLYVEYNAYFFTMHPNTVLQCFAFQAELDPFTPSHLDPFSLLLAIQ